MQVKKSKIGSGVSLPSFNIDTVELNKKLRSLRNGDASESQVGDLTLLGIVTATLSLMGLVSLIANSLY